MIQARHIRQDYLSEASALKPFYQYSPQAPDFAKIMADKQFPDAHRQMLVKVLKEQYDDLELPQAVVQNLEALGQEHTYTVTTGHQLGVMGGPLFTVYKVMSIIKLAEKLNADFPHRKVVPLFWIHTEDHDFEEINHFYTAFGVKHTYGGQFSGAVGDHVLTEEIQALVPANFDEKLAESWSPEITLAQAFRRFFHALLGEYGVIMLDASDARLKAIFREVMNAEIETQASFSAVNETTLALHKAGYKIQIHPREINLFYLDRQGRNRIATENGHFTAIDRDFNWSQAELLNLMAEHPEQFSPNVSLRPLYQEMILPNLAYIGGWGELSYWLQLKGVFERYRVNFPLLLPRFSATVVRESQAVQLQDWGLELQDIRLPLHELFAEYMPHVWSDEAYLAQANQILQQIEALKDYVATDVSDTLARSVAALKTKSERFIRTIHKKAYRVKRHQYPQVFEEIQALKRVIQPDGLVQERVWSLGAIGINPHEFVREVAAVCDPLDFSHHMIIIKDS